MNERCADERAPIDDTAPNPRPAAIRVLIDHDGDVRVRAQQNVATLEVRPTLPVFGKLTERPF